MMMSPASMLMATKRRCPLSGSRVARKSQQVTSGFENSCVVVSLLTSAFPLCGPAEPAGWAISTQDTEASSTCLKRGSTRTAASLEPRFPRSSQSGASETCSGIWGVLFTPSTKLVTLSCRKSWPRRAWSLPAAAPLFLCDSAHFNICCSCCGTDVVWSKLINSSCLI